MAICPLVQISFGENVVLVVPVVMPFSTAQLTAVVNVVPAGTSVNVAVVAGVGLPAACYIYVTAIALLHKPSTSNVLPDTMPFS